MGAKNTKLNNINILNAPSNLLDTPTFLNNLPTHTDILNSTSNLLSTPTFNDGIASLPQTKDINLIYTSISSLPQKTDISNLLSTPAFYEWQL